LSHQTVKQKFAGLSKKVVSLETLRYFYYYLLTLKRTNRLEENLMPANIGILDFCYENSFITVVANRNFAEIKLAGLNVGPFDEGNEYQIYYWIAKELQAAGIVHLREEETLDGSKLYKVQWKEGVQIPGMISEVPQDFYPKLRRYLTFAEAEAVQPEKFKNIIKLKH
jgi:hypothetical protein